MKEFENPEIEIQHFVIENELCDSNVLDERE